MDAKSRLRDAGIDSFDLDARLLVQLAFGMTPEEILLHSSKETGAPETKTLNELLRRRLAREPVSRIFGRRHFWKSEFKISKETLDPRPDSETLIEAVLKRGGRGRILDLGTGSGCLLLSLLQEMPQSQGIGIDISSDAIETARENMRALGLEKRAAFQLSDWADFRPDSPFDIVVANPPYIAEAEMEWLEPEVTLHDPRRALVADEGGLACYRVISGLLDRFLTPSGMAFFEVGHTQAGAVSDLLGQVGYTVLQIVPDLSGKDRCIVAQKAR